MRKNMKDVFENAFDKQKNYNQILNVVTMNNRSKKELKQGKISGYALAIGGAAGAITVAWVIGKIWTNNHKSMKLEMN